MPRPERLKIKELCATLNYDFSEEKKFSYKNLSMDETIHHLAVFFIKYLRALGFDVTNDIFAENAWYFRNSLVRANYNNLKNGIHATTEFLELFLRNLLLNETHSLHNRTLHISGTFKGTENRTLTLYKRTLKKSFNRKPQIIFLGYVRHFRIRQFLDVRI